MMKIVLSEWSEWSSNDDIYKKWNDNLQWGLKNHNEEILNGEIGITFPSTNYDTYMVFKDGKTYVTTANNHDWSPLNDILVYSGEGEDDGERDNCNDILKGRNFFNVRNRLIHSHEKYDFDNEKMICSNPECEYNYGSYVIIDDEKVCAECYVGILGTKNLRDPKGEVLPRKQSIDFTDVELEELINGLECATGASKWIDLDLHEKLLQKLKQKHEQK